MAKRIGASPGSDKKVDNSVRSEEEMSPEGVDVLIDAQVDEFNAQKEAERLAAEAEQRFNTEVGERLRHLREVLGLTVTEVANQLNVTRQTLSNYESGRTPLRASVIRELAEIYEASCDWILGTRNDIEINVMTNGGRSLYMRESSPRIYPASVKTEEDKRKYDLKMQEKARIEAEMEEAVLSNQF